MPTYDVDLFDADNDGDVDSHNGFCQDVDADGRPDIFVTNELNNRDYLLMNTGATFVDETIARGIPDTTNVHTHDAEAADLDGDGLPEIVLVSRDDIPPLVLLNDNNNPGHFSDATNAMLPGASGEISSEVDAVDVDCDGDNDLLILNGDPNQGNPPGVPGLRGENRLYINDNGIFSEHARDEGFSVGAVNVSTDAEAGDIDGDGDLDIVVANWFESTMLFVNQTDPFGGQCP